MAKRAQRGRKQPSGERPAPVAPERSRSAQASVALIGGIFLVVAAAIAGGTALYNTNQLQDHENARDERQDQRDRARDAARARGAARLLMAELLQASVQMEILGRDRALRRFEPSYRIAVPADDMALIAATLRAEHWGAVQDAVTNTEGLETFVNTQIERGRRVLTAGEACYARIDMRSIVHAAEALADLADAPGSPPPLKPIRCKPRPGPLPRELRRRLEAVGADIAARPLRPGETPP